MLGRPAPMASGGRSVSSIQSAGRSVMVRPLLHCRLIQQPMSRLSGIDVRGGRYGRGDGLLCSRDTACDRGMPRARAICLGLLPAVRNACARVFRSSLFMATSSGGLEGYVKIPVVVLKVAVDGREA